MRKSNNFTTFKERQKYWQPNEQRDLFWFVLILDRFLSLSITPMWQLLVMQGCAF